MWKISQSYRLPNLIQMVYQELKYGFYLLFPVIRISSGLLLHVF